MPNDYVFVGDYRLEETLGVGSFGKVKRMSWWGLLEF